MLKWRKFNFFDLKSNIDRGKVAEVLKVNPFNRYFCLNFYFRLIDNTNLSKEFKVNDLFSCFSLVGSEHKLYDKWQ